MLHVISFLNLYKLTNCTITYFINELLLKEDIIIASALLSIWYKASTCMSYNQNLITFYNFNKILIFSNHL